MIDYIFNWFKPAERILHKDLIKEDITVKFFDRDVIKEDYDLFNDIFKKWCLFHFNKEYPLTDININNFLEDIFKVYAINKLKYTWYFHSFSNNIIVLGGDCPTSQMPLLDNKEYVKTNNEHYSLCGNFKYVLLFFSVYLNKLYDNRTDNT